MNTIHYLYDHVADIERDMGLQFIVSEETKSDVLEAEIGWNGDRVFYATKPVLNVEALVHGFVWQHPHGGTIRGNFDKPLTLATACLDDDGAEIDFDSNYCAVGNAIVAKLGKVAGLGEIYI